MRSEFELTDQDSADGKDCTVMTTVVGKNWNWVTFLSGDVEKEFVITKTTFPKLDFCRSLVAGLRCSFPE